MSFALQKSLIKAYVIAFRLRLLFVQENKIGLLSGIPESTWTTPPLNISENTYMSRIELSGVLSFTVCLR